MNFHLDGQIHPDLGRKKKLSMYKAGVQQTDPELPVSRLLDIEIVLPLQVYPENEDPI